MKDQRELTSSMVEKIRVPGAQEQRVMCDVSSLTETDWDLEKSKLNQGPLKLLANTEREIRALKEICGPQRNVGSQS